MYIFTIELAFKSFERYYCVTVKWLQNGKIFKKRFSYKNNEHS